MDAKILVIITGAILVIAILVSLVMMRRNPNRFTYDTAHGTRPRASEGEGNTSQVAFKGRFTMLAAGVGAVFAAIFAKLWSMQMGSSDYYEGLSDQNQTRTVTTPAPRGRILDRNGTPLVTNRPCLTVAAYRSLADDTVTVRHLANVLGMPYIAVKRNIQNYNESAQSLHTVASDVRRSTVAYIQEHASFFKKCRGRQAYRALLPVWIACRSSAWVYGYHYDEQLEKQDDDENKSAGTIAYKSGDIVGQTGVELQYERLLQGIRGEQTVQVNAAGAVTGRSGAVPAEPGSDVKLTIDLSIQQACESGLAHAIPDCEAKRA